MLLASVLLFCTQAYAIPVGQLIQNGQFGTNTTPPPSLSNWTTGGTAGARSSTAGVNTQGGANGFNSFFTSAFAVLGATFTSGISGGPISGISSISQTFTLPTTQSGNTIFVYDLTISFMMAFDGDDSGPSSPGANIHDVFTASLNNVAFLTQDSAPLNNCTAGLAGCSNVQIEQNPFSITLRNLRPGTYTLQFALNEAATTVEGSATETAVGLDAISVTGEAFVPEPGTLVLLATGLVALGAISIRRRGRQQA
jgi:hypothetical protein